MKFIKIMILFMFGLSASCCHDVLNMPEYKLIKRFSKRIKKSDGIYLYCYGINALHPVPEDHIEGKISDFSVSYEIYKKRTDSVSLDSARCLVVSIAESFLKEINSDPKIKNELSKYPLPSDRIHVILHFRDENDVELGNEGISSVFLERDKIEYERYEIREYTPPIPVGRHFTVHEERYGKALEIVKNQGCLREL